MTHAARLLACSSLASLLLTGSTSASTLFSEDFSGATPGTYGVGPIAGTGVSVTTDNVDIVGVLNGSFYSCVDNPGGNCLDLVGNGGRGGIASNTAFNLTAGETYTVKFGAILQGYAAGQGNTTFTVALGSQSVTESVNGTAQQFSLAFVPLVSETGADLAFTTVVPGDGSHGAVLDNITLTSGVPEPESWALMLTGFGVAGGLIRRGRSVASVATT